MHGHVCGQLFDHLLILILHFLLMCFRASNSPPPPNPRSQTSRTLLDYAQVAFPVVVNVSNVRYRLV